MKTKPLPLTGVAVFLWMCPMFNADQRSYMASLSRIPPEEKCYCGWYLLGECHSCPPGMTCADKIAARCEWCHNAPEPLAGGGVMPITHRLGCLRPVAEEVP